MPWLNRFIGSTDTFTTRERTLHSVLLIGALVLLVALVSNRLNGLSGWLDLACAGGIMMLVLLYRLSIRGVKGIWRFHAFYGLTLLMLSLIWFLGGGMTGSALYNYFIALTLILLLYSPEYYGPTAVIFLSNVLCNIWLEFHYPHLVIPYPSTSAKLIDIVAGFFFTCISVSYAVWRIQRHYEQERSLNLRQQALLTEQAGILRQQHQEVLRLNEHLAQANVVIEERAEELERQYAVLDVRSTEINESLLYARRIQDTILPDTQELSRLLPAHFLMYETKEIVSGDFFWISEVPGKPGQVLLAVADCTGHGVPSALISMIGANSLHELVYEQHLTTPELILQELDNRIRRTLRQGTADPGRAVHDGMDIVMVLFDAAAAEVRIATAKRKFLMIKANGERVEVRGEYFSVGGEEPRDKVFACTSLAWQRGDTAYLFTDGLSDQKSEQGKKLTYARVAQTLVELHALPLEQRGSAFRDWWLTWKGDAPLTDDALLVAVARL